MGASTVQEDWDIITRFLPKGWEEKAKELGALARRRKIDSANTLLRVLLIHLADGKSLRTTATYAQQANLCSINDVALLHRLRASEQWFLWLATQLLKELPGRSFPSELARRYRVRLVDGSSVSEPGSTGTDYRIHYSFQLTNLRCDFFSITTPKTGESFRLYPVQGEDLLIGDRAYCKRKGIMHVLDSGGQVLVRFHSTNLPLFTRQGKPQSTLMLLRSLAEGQVGDWDVWFRSPADETLIKGRLCSIRKSKEACEVARNKLRRKASKTGKKFSASTMEHAEYVTLFTTVNRHNFKASELLTLYRARWQIELVFKRLKGIVGIGHLPKHHRDSCVPWLYGKMVVALLSERLHQEAEFFSPWGYPIRCPTGE